MIVIVAPGQGSQTPGFLEPWLTEQRFADQLGAISEAVGLDLVAHGTTSDADTIRERLEKLVDLIVDGGVCANGPSTVIDLTGAEPEVVRLGQGDPAALGL